MGEVLVPRTSMPPKNVMNRPRAMSTPAPAAGLIGVPEWRDDARINEALPR